MFSALFIHITSYFYICHNFQPFLQKTGSLLFADIISALYNPFEECEARFVHRKGWAQWREDRNPAIAIYFLEQHNSPLFPIILFHFAQNNFHGKLSVFPSLTMSEQKKDIK